MSLRPFHHQRPLVSVSLAYGLGVWAGVSFAWRPGLAAAGMGASCLACFFLRRDGRKMIVGVMAAFLFLGLLLAGGAAHPLLPEEGKYQITAVLSTDAELRENDTAAAYLEQATAEQDGKVTPLGRLYWTYTPDANAPFLPVEGDRVAFTASLYHPRGQVNPFGFDFRMYLLQKGVTLGASGAKDWTRLGHPGRGVSSFLFHIRQALTQRVRLIFGEDSALPEALLLGQRSQLPEETVQGFSDAGTAHLLAVSGLHVGLLAGMLMIPLRHFLPPKKRAAVLGAFLLVYCALLDFSAPVVRASLLMVFAAWRRVTRRAPDPLTALSAAFLLLLLVRPLDLFSASFQLSFCAVLGIVVFGGLFPQPQGRSLVRTAAEAWRTTVTATAGVALPTIQIFHRFSLIGLLVNPFACAFFSLLLPVYFTVTAVGCLWLQGGWALAGLVNPVTRGLVAAMTWLGEKPFASVRLPALPWFCVLALALAWLLISRYVARPGKWKLPFALLAVLLSFGAWRLTVCRDVQFVQLAMGQADAAVLMDGGETAVIDAGLYGGDLASFLLANGRQADHLILTHLHSDHCRGILQLLKEKIPIGAVYLPQGAEEQLIDPQCLDMIQGLRERGIPVYHLKSGDTVSLPRSTLTAVWPQGDTVRPGQDANRYCLALLCELDGVKLLTCGDLTGDFEQYAALDADILKVAHHGSGKSTGDGFLDAVTPKTALITDSGNSASLPHPDTLKRLRERGIQVYQTGKAGAVTITVRRGEAALITFLPQQIE